MLRHMMTFVLVAASLIVGGCDSDPGPDDSAATMGSESGSETDAVASSSSEADSTGDADSSGSSGGEHVGDGQGDDHSACINGSDCESGICEETALGRTMCIPAPCEDDGKADLNGDPCSADEECGGDYFDSFECRFPSKAFPTAGFCTATCG